MNGALCAIEQIDTHPRRPSLDTGNSLCYRTQPLRGPRGGHFGRIAQLVEQLTLNQRVPGSSPGAPTNKQAKSISYGSRALSKHREAPRPHSVSAPCPQKARRCVLRARGSHPTPGLPKRTGGRRRARARRSFAGIMTGIAQEGGRPMFDMRRREFISLLGGAAVAWPLAAGAQPTGGRIPRIGIIDDAPIWDHFRQGLRDNGYVVGQNVALEYRAAQSNVDLLRRAALELAALPVNVLVAQGTPATRAARQATSTIPIVMIGVGDPVRAGFVTNLARPDGNITGNSQLAPELIGKRLEILKDYVPGLARVAFMWNPDNDSNLAFLEELIIAVPALGLQLISVPMRTSDDFVVR